MDPPLNIGFSDHVMNFSPGGPHIPQFPAPPGFHHVTPIPVNTFLNDPAPPDVSGPAPKVMAAVPYGFISDNWIEERQSWFPVTPCGEDPVGEEMAVRTTTGGFRVGFEDYGDLSDPTAHHMDSAWQHHPTAHHMDSAWQHHPTAHHMDSTWQHHPTAHHMDSAWQHHPTAHHMDSAWQHHPAGGDMWSQGMADQRRSSMYDAAQTRGQEAHVTIKLQEAPERRDPEVTAFCQAVCSIRRRYKATDRTNTGRIWSVAVPVPDDVPDSQVEISVTDRCNELTTVQRDSIRVGDLVADVLWRIQDPAASPPAPLYPSHDLYLLSCDPPPLYPLSRDTTSLYPSLKLPVTPRAPGEEAEPAGSVCHLTVCGLDEYLQPGHSLRSHVVLQRQRSIQLRLHVGGDPRGPLARTAEDDEAELGLGDRTEHAQYWQELRKRVFGAVAHYEDQVRYFLHNRWSGVSGSGGGVLAAVEEICYLLRSVETQEISDAVQSLRVRELPAAGMNWAQSTQMADPVALALGEISSAVSQLLDMYSRSFHTDFTAESRGSGRSEVGSDFLSFRLYAAHNLPENWSKRDGVFYVSCSVLYAGRKICPEVKSREVTASRSFFIRAVWDEMIQFPVPPSALPYESMLVLRLYTVTPTTPAGSFLAWSCLPLYCNQQLVQGALLMNMVSHAEPPAVITPTALDASLPTLITMQVDFPHSDVVYQRPAVAEETSGDPGAEDQVWGIQYMANRCSVLLLSEVDRRSLWYYRHCPRPPPHLLPLLLGSAPGWAPPSISAMYRVLEDWTFSGPLEALGLLSPCFADEKIRAAACRELGRLSCDQMLELLPQLVQAVKYERHLDSDLVRLLLHRALQSIQLAHRLYWLLTDASSQPHYRALYLRLVDAVQCCAGRSLSDEFSKQRRLLRILQDVTEKVKDSPEDKRKDALRFGLLDVERFFEDVGSCRLPQNSAIVVKGIDRELCSFFKSNAKPLKISFINADEQGPNIHIMYKVGDDMRQDMLVLQLVEIMDRIWLHKGLDLRMITYRCMSTGRKQGLVQLVPDSITLAKIQNKSGVFGPLKDSSMKKWFQNNQTASDNFLFSCAGWCVVTFLLGVCDRHNDNIMLTSSGHMFHIDFGKFLGNAQMFGSIKRDRAPFIFTTEMESFITQEGQHPHRAREFVEICCCAYNVLRRHSALIITLLELMLQAGLPELRSVEDLRYVYNRLRPDDSDLEAATYFTSKIQESLQTPSVKLNFLVHAFANMTPSDLSRLGEGVTPAIAKFIKRATAKVQKVGGRILEVLSDTDPAGTGGSARSVQLHIGFSPPRLCVQLKHLRNIPPEPTLTISLYSGPREVSSQEIRGPSRRSAPISSQLVQFVVPQLEGLVLRIQVRSGGRILGQLLLPLGGVRLWEDVWYHLGA